MGADPVDGREVDVRETPEGLAEPLVSPLADDSLLARVRMGWNRLISTVVGLQVFDLAKQALVVLRDGPLGLVKQAQGHRQVVDVLVAPVAREMLGDRLEGLLAGLVAQGCQPKGIALSADDGAHDRHPGVSGQVAHGAMDPDIHLVERLLHPLDKPRPGLHEVGALALSTPATFGRIAPSAGPPPSRRLSLATFLIFIDTSGVRRFSGPSRRRR